MREIAKQFLKIWQEMKLPQKLCTLTIVLFVCSALCYLVFRSSHDAYVSLYPNNHLRPSELAEIRSYLDHFSIPFKEGKEKEITVAEEHAERIRMELATAGIPKLDSGQGFELFDTNTWIKGEKELQVLEMRALKGQLEKDLIGFDQIQSASVILDMAPSRTFGQQKYKTKASVILTLMPGATLSLSQQRAITYHLAGAVRGLESNMIAISDTKGRLYKAIDPDGVQDGPSDKQLVFEESIREKIDQMLTKIVGPEHFYSTLQAVVDPATKEVASLALTALIDQSILSEQTGVDFGGEIERQMKAIISGYGVSCEPVVDFVPFEKKRMMWIEKPKEQGSTGLIFIAVFVLLTLIALISLFRGYKKKQEDPDPDEELFRMMTRIDVHTLADSIEGEDPETVAMMLSYLEPSRAETMLAAFSEPYQEEVLFHLSELENES